MESPRTKRNVHFNEILRVRVHNSAVHSVICLFRDVSFFYTYALHQAQATKKDKAVDTLWACRGWMSFLDSQIIWRIFFFVNLKWFLSLKWLFFKPKVIFALLLWQNPYLFSCSRGETKRDKHTSCLVSLHSFIFQSHCLAGHSFLYLFYIFGSDFIMGSSLIFPD